jgi:alkylhydroperoxidase family enzyme
MGSAVGRRQGISEEQLRQLSVYQQSDVFSTVEKLVLDYAVGVTSTPAEAPDELFARLREYFDEQQMVELTAAIAWENYRVRFNHAFGLESQGFADGAYCALPEHPAELTRLGSHW